MKTTGKIWKAAFLFQHLWNILYITFSSNLYRAKLYIKHGSYAIIVFMRLIFFIKLAIVIDNQVISLNLVLNTMLVESII